MQVLIGVLILGLLAGFGLIVAALFDEGTALRVAAVLLARVEARVAYRTQFSKTYRERCAEFEIPEKFGPADAVQEERA